MTYRITVSQDSAIDILGKILSDDYKSLTKDFYKIAESGEGFIFSADWKEDLTEISQLKAAILRVLQYYKGEDVNPYI